MEIDLHQRFMVQAITHLRPKALNGPTESIKDELLKKLGSFAGCLNEGKDLIAARLLEFEFLPELDQELLEDSHSMESTKALTFGKSEIVELTQEIIARLDPSRATETK